MTAFLGLEPLLDARLDGAISFNNQAVDVRSARAVPRDTNGEPVLRVPALLISYDGYRPTDNSSHGRTSKVSQTWSVTVVIANLRDGERLGARADGSHLIDQVLQRLLGWEPADADGPPFAPLQLAPPSYPVQFGTRNTYIPISFTTERMFQGAR